MSNLQKFVGYAHAHDIIYNERERREFGLMGRRALREITRALSPISKDVHYNPAGIATSGDLTAIMMFNNKIGLYISVNKRSPKSKLTIMYRTVMSMDDWTGGSNNFADEEEFQDLEFWKNEKEKIINRGF